MILAGDIGGTKTVLALYDTKLATIREQTFDCADFPSLEAVLDAFALDAPVEGACFGVAGPVIDRAAKITNLPWVIDAAVLAAKLGAPVWLLNDLQATALGTLVLRPEQLAVLQRAARPTSHGTIAVIAPGTGLGEAVLLHDGRRYLALPSEGGHADFAPGSDDEIELLQFLRGRHGPHVSVERVLSGPGIGELYDFWRHKLGTPEPGWLTAQLAAGDRNAAVANAALAGTDPACVAALGMFAEILGAEAGNHALRSLALGGVMIGGGIPPKILPALQAGPLVERFCRKGRFSAWARALAISVVLEPRAALYGAANYVLTSKDPLS